MRINAITTEIIEINKKEFENVTRVLEMICQIEHEYLSYNTYIQNVDSDEVFNIEDVSMVYRFLCAMCNNYLEIKTREVKVNE